MADDADAPASVVVPEPTADRSLETLAVATCDLALFGLALVLAGHLTGVLADALGGLGTVPGLAAFAYLWALLVLATRWALSAADLRESGLGTLSLRGTVAGSLVGIVFVLGAVLVGGVAALARGAGPEPLSIALVALIGAAVAAVVGAAVGLIATLVTVGLHRAGDAVAAVDPDTDPRD
ncbi:MAG: hypothetical protein ABEI96_07315 [Haloarculaceae archaeon]